MKSLGGRKLPRRSLAGAGVNILTRQLMSGGGGGSAGGGGRGDAPKFLCCLESESRRLLALPYWLQFLFYAALKRK